MWTVAPTPVLELALCTRMWLLGHCEPSQARERSAPELLGVSIMHITQIIPRKC